MGGSAINRSVDNNKSKVDWQAELYDTSTHITGTSDMIMNI